MGGGMNAGGGGVLHAGGVLWGVVGCGGESMLTLVGLLGGCGSLLQDLPTNLKRLAYVVVRPLLPVYLPRLSPVPTPLSAAVRLACSLLRAPLQVLVVVRSAC
jgi:hypothetical protein